ncbi:hypothetical protein DYB32_008093 [Aphanomyces invadans]|uniref:BTB domain-containing protein n=1 Tax=Aphanomyces invadans TaxID=157072 RepID=A0A3R6YZN9_9STRA|nr:hypothetical protein DYB32_008093 [Aphanomyces invadans]
MKRVKRPLPSPPASTRHDAAHHMSMSFDQMSRDMQGQIESWVVKTASMWHAMAHREAAWADMQARAADTIARAANVVVLNVGGVRFATAKTTLLRFDGSLFHSLLGSTWSDAGNKELFLDLHGPTFDRIVGYLRSGRLCLDNLNAWERSQVLFSVDYLNLPQCAADHQPVDDSNSIAPPFEHVATGGAWPDGPEFGGRNPWAGATHESHEPPPPVRGPSSPTFSTVLLGDTDLRSTAPKPGLGRPVSLAADSGDHRRESTPTPPTSPTFSLVSFGDASTDMDCGSLSSPSSGQTLTPPASSIHPVADNMIPSSPPTSWLEGGATMPWTWDVELCASDIAVSRDRRIVYVCGRNLLRSVLGDTPVVMFRVRLDDISGETYVGMAPKVGFVPKHANQGYYLGLKNGWLCETAGFYVKAYYGGRFVDGDVLTVQRWRRHIRFARNGVDLGIAFQVDPTLELYPVAAMKRRAKVSIVD